MSNKTDSRMLLFQKGEWRTEKEGIPGLKWIERRKASNQWASTVALDKYTQLQKAITRWVYTQYIKPI